jgi:hypothetical protein
VAFNGGRGFLYYITLIVVWSNCGEMHQWQSSKVVSQHDGISPARANLRHNYGLLSVGPKKLENGQFDDLHMQEQRLLHKRFPWGGLTTVQGTGNRRAMIRGDGG